jgi:hypothetical protein
MSYRKLKLQAVLNTWITPSQTWLSIIKSMCSIDEKNQKNVWETAGKPLLDVFFLLSFLLFSKRVLKLTSLFSFIGD